MEVASNNSNRSATTTPSKKKNSENSENLNPNVPQRSLSSKSPALKPSKPNNTNPVVQSPQKRIRQRKFFVAKKNNQKGSRNDAVSCKCKDNGGAKCVCVAYQTLRASQEEFFLKESKGYGEEEEEEAKEEEGYDFETEGTQSETVEDEEKEGGSTVKRRRERDRLLEEARNSVPENGFGKVMHLVKAFEKLLTIPKSSKEDQDQDLGEKGYKKKVMKWALPGLQFEQQHEALEATSGSGSSSSFCYNSDVVLTSENLGLDQGISVSSSWDSSRARFDFRFYLIRSRAKRRSSFFKCSWYCSANAICFINFGNSNNISSSGMVS